MIVALAGHLLVKEILSEMVETATETDEDE